MEAKIKAIAPWFGGNRILAPAVGEELAGCTWVGIPFAGGMSEVFEIDASSIVVNDKHRHVVNLAFCIADPAKRREIIRHANRVPFHPDVLSAAQEFCAANLEPAIGDVDAAKNYFVAAWMARSGIGGGRGEFTGRTPVRWNANGGDSNTRFRSAIRSVATWSQVMRRCNFRTEDAFDFLDQIRDDAKNGIYVDAPWPDAGEKYRHKFTAADQKRLRDSLVRFRLARVVVRFGVHPLISELYDRSVWTWRTLSGRKQSNATSPEVLLINGPSRARRGDLFS